MTDGRADFGGRPGCFGFGNWMVIVLGGDSRDCRASGDTSVRVNGAIDCYRLQVFEVKSFFYQRVRPTEPLLL